MRAAIEDAQELAQQLSQWTAMGSRPTSSYYDQVLSLSLSLPLCVVVCIPPLHSHPPLTRVQVGAASVSPYESSALGEFGGRLERSLPFPTPSGVSRPPTSAYYDRYDHAPLSRWLGDVSFSPSAPNTCIQSSTKQQRGQTTNSGVSCCSVSLANAGVATKPSAAKDR